MYNKRKKNLYSKYCVTTDRKVKLPIRSRFIAFKKWFGINFQYLGQELFYHPDREDIDIFQLFHLQGIIISNQKSGNNENIQSKNLGPRYVCVYVS